MALLRRYLRTEIARLVETRKADAEGLPWVMVLHGDRLRLYPTAVGTGVGRRGRTETYVEVQTSLLANAFSV
jgi:hypothetical protein